MKTLEIKHLLYTLLAAITLGLSSCSSENEEPANFNKLPQAIAQDFRNRCASNTLKVFTVVTTSIVRAINKKHTYTLKIKREKSALWFILTTYGTAQYKSCLTLTSCPTKYYYNYSK